MTYHDSGARGLWRVSVLTAVVRQGSSQSDIECRAPRSLMRPSRTTPQQYEAFDPAANAGTIRLGVSRDGKH